MDIRCSVALSILSVVREDDSKGKSSGGGRVENCRVVEL